MTTTNSKDASTEKPAETTATTASSVAKIVGQLVVILEPLPPAMQIRALGATATTLGIDKEQRRSGGTQQQQRSTNGGSQNRSGSR